MTVLHDDAECLEGEISSRTESLLTLSLYGMALSQVNTHQLLARYTLFCFTLFYLIFIRVPLNYNLLVIEMNEKVGEQVAGHIGTIKAQVSSTLGHFCDLPK